MNLSIFGEGLGSGAHSKKARQDDKASEGEGLLRQGIPEIGLVGIAVFVLFTLSSIFSLLKSEEKFKITIRFAGPNFWIALPLALELFRAPIDIAIRSFLSTGIVWYLAGVCITIKEKLIRENFWKNQKTISLIG